MPEILPNLHDAVGYLLLARIENDVISTSESDDERFEPDAESGEGTWVDHGTKYTTSRTTTMLFAIYDLQTTSLQWRARFETSHEQVRTVDSTDEGLLALLGLFLGDGDASDYPPPTSIPEQADRLYREFLKRLFASE